RVSRTELVDSLREGGRSLTGGVQSRRMRGVLVVTEFAMAVVLLAGAGLLIRSLAALRAVDLGFRPERVMTLRVVIPNSKFPDGNQLAMVVGRIMEQIRSIPGVTAAGAIRDIFLSQTPNSGIFTIEGRAPIPDEQRTEATIDPITPEYFTAMGVS